MLPSQKDEECVIYYLYFYPDRPKADKPPKYALEEEEKVSDMQNKLKQMVEKERKLKEYVKRGTDRVVSEAKDSSAIRRVVFRFVSIFLSLTIVICGVIAIVKI